MSNIAKKNCLTCSSRNFDTNREHLSGSLRPSKLSSSLATADKPRSA